MEDQCKKMTNPEIMVMKLKEIKCPGYYPCTLQVLAKRVSRVNVRTIDYGTWNKINQCFRCESYLGEAE